MRTALEIAFDLVIARNRLWTLDQTNRHGKTTDEIIQIEAETMEQRKRISELMREETNFVHGDAYSLAKG